MAAMSPSHRPLGPALWRGLRGRCPSCGSGRLFRGYLKVSPACQGCAHDLAQYPSDDGPAYLTILLVGHLLIAPLLLFPFIWEESPWLVVPLTLVPLAAVTLLVLPRIKGAFIGLLWALGVRRGDARLHTADAPD